MLLTILLAALLSVRWAYAAIPNAMVRRRHIQISPIPVRERTVTGPSERGVTPTVYHFEQLIDHDNPGLGTFWQRFWVNNEFYKPGGPIVLTTPGEGNGKDFLGFLDNTTMSGMIAQQQQGATVLIEHRFFGDSTPYEDYSSQSLEVLTIQQAINDFVYFAQNVDLPFTGGDNVKPNTAPWLFIGGSYGGALVSWTMFNKPGIFRAGYASSASVEAITDFYDYFTPIMEYMPQNCSSDVQAVVAYLDQIYAKNDDAAMQSLKEAFGLRNISHIDDFAAALQMNLFDWEFIQPNSGRGTMFYNFCDALEVKDGVNAPATGWGLENAINAWGLFWNTTYYKYVCDTMDAETCLGTYDPSRLRGTNIYDPSRAWFWLTCNQLGFYRVSPPTGRPTIVSRILQPGYSERLCVSRFPDKFSSPPTPTSEQVDATYGGWGVTVDRLFYANNLRDPWRGATVSADGLNKPSTNMQPIYEADAFHASDLFADIGNVDESVHNVQVAALEYMRTWLA